MRWSCVIVGSILLTFINLLLFIFIQDNPLKWAENMAVLSKRVSEFAAQYCLDVTILPFSLALKVKCYKMTTTYRCCTVYHIQPLVAVVLQISVFNPCWTHDSSWIPPLL